MPNWAGLAANANAKLFAKFGETVSYSRPASRDLDAVDAFELTAIRDTSEKSISTDAKAKGFTFVLSEIPSGPKKGDTFVASDGTYQVMAIVPSDSDDTVMVGARKLPA